MVYCLRNRTGYVSYIEKLRLLKKAALKMPHSCFTIWWKRIIYILEKEEQLF